MAVDFLDIVLHSIISVVQRHRSRISSELVIAMTTRRYDQEKKCSDKGD